MAVFVGLLAAGSGQRFGADVPKCFIPFEGRPLVLRSYQTIRTLPWIDRVIIAVPSGYEKQPDLSCTASYNDIVVRGGSTRRESVSNILVEIDNRFSPEDGDLIFIHDAARAFCSQDLWERTYDAVRSCGAVTTAVKSVDSLKEIDSEGRVVQSLQRGRIVKVQTPQAFRYPLLRRAHQEFPLDSEATDDASMVEPFHPVWIVAGEAENQKITLPQDLR